MNTPLTACEKERFSALMESIPYDGTDWDGIGPDTARAMIVWCEKSKTIPQMMDHNERILVIAEHQNERFIKIRDWAYKDSTKTGYDAEDKIEEIKKILKEIEIDA